MFSQLLIAEIFVQIVDDTTETLIRLQVNNATSSSYCFNLLQVNNATSSSYCFNFYFKIAPTAE